MEIVMRSICVVGVSIGLLEPSLAALEQLLSEGSAVFRLTRIGLQTGHEGVILRRALLLDDKHAWCALILSRKPR